ncbi:NAD(P)/FAD-dependent oxidoreductase [Amnibacterium endophyticum]|uniref:NAD(P)/FAD-dependent oxidoreductase n=1 Tax=Amnibacterium endophyticum TaxID=2109337 RepID=A0ABW4LHM4_9MICO
MTQDWDAVVVGGGAAGLSAAQMLGRSRRRTLVIDAGAPRNAVAAHMHGVLGHDGLDPAELLDRGRAEARRYGVEVVEGDVRLLRDEGESIRVLRADGQEDTARVVVVASGVRDVLPDVPGLREEWGRRALHCPYCHGWEVAGQRLAVLATGPQSLHQAELVRQLSDDVVVFSAAAEPCDEAALGRLVARGVRIVRDPVREVVRGEALTLVTEDGREREVDAVFTGGAPTVPLDLLGGIALERADLPGAPLQVTMSGATSHPRLFAAGNVVQPYGNVPVAMASGAMAGAGANAALVAEDGARAVADRTAALRGSAA